jgi:hypothetical protein
MRLPMVGVAEPAVLGVSSVVSSRVSWGPSSGLSSGVSSKVSGLMIGASRPATDASATSVGCILTAAASSNRCEYRGASSDACIFFLAGLSFASALSSAANVANGVLMTGVGVFVGLANGVFVIVVTRAGTGRCFLGGAARRPRGVKSGTSIDGTRRLAPNMPVLDVGGVYGVVGGATCPCRCLFCSALTRCWMLGLWVDRVSQCADREEKKKKVVKCKNGGGISEMSV